MSAKQPNRLTADQQHCYWWGVWVAASGGSQHATDPLDTYKSAEGRKHALRAPASAPGQSVDNEVDRTWIALLNRSEEPVYQAVASLVLIQGAGPRTGKETQPEYRATLSVIPPGQYYIDVAGGWAGMSARPGVELAFTDRAAAHWIRSANGDLTQLEQAPVDYYELGLPQAWSIPVADDNYRLYATKRGERPRSLALW